MLKQFLDNQCSDTQNVRKLIKKMDLSSHLVISYSKTHDKIWKIATGKDDDCTTRCSLDYPYFEK